MNSRQPLHIVSLISMLIFLLTGQAGVQGYVLCLTDNGHAALEFVGSDSCEPVSAEFDRTCLWEGPDASSSDEHCGPCTDLPTSFDAASRRSQEQGDILIDAGVASIPATAPAALAIRNLTTSLLPNPPPRISQTLLAHRTVVLLN